MKIALIGDYHAEVTAHQAIPLAIDLAAGALSLQVGYDWIASTEAAGLDASAYSAIWCVPYSPYADPQSVIETIRYARESDLPFLGTCAGFQHALIEYARNVLGYTAAASLEDDPQTEMPLITALGCRLYDESDAIDILAQSRVGGLYRGARVVEQYHCGFGFNPEYRSLFDAGDMIFSGFDSAGEPRILEIPAHRYFIATAFQPERAALAGETHPLIVEFLRAAE